MSARAATALLLFAATVVGCDRGKAEAEWLDAQAAPPIRALGVKSGDAFDLAGQRGKVVLLSFGYTSCLEICPTTLGVMQGVLRRLGGDASRFQAVYASVDPQRDQPAPFRAFLGEFDERIEGLYLEGDALAQVLRDYGVTAEKRPPEVRRYVGRTVDPERDYSIDHTASLWLIDPRGALRVRYSHRATPDTIAEGVRRLLQEGEG